MTHDKALAETLRRARESKGLAIDECAAAVGLNEESYSDGEAYGDELFDNMSLGTARRICRLLDLNLLELIVRHLGVTIVHRQPMAAAQYYARHNLISEARAKAGLSADQLGDAIGFEEVVVASLERTSDFIETMPIVPLVELSKTLHLDPGLVIGDLGIR